MATGTHFRVQKSPVFRLWKSGNPISRGITTTSVTITAVLPQWSVTIPLEIRGYLGIPVIPFTAQLCIWD